MATIVGGFLLPHEPGIFHMPPEKWTDGQRRVRAAYEQIAVRIGLLGATTALVIGADHYVLFGPGCLPSYLVGIGDVTGPYERFPGIDQGVIPNNPPLARHLVDFSRSQGFDWAVAKSLRVDHSIGVPARLCALASGTVQTVVPVYLASGVEPLLPMRRAHALGAAIRQAIEAWKEDEKVVVIASGGISHWVGLPEMGRVNVDFDQWILDCVTRGEVEPMLQLTDREVLEQAGNGGWEIRSFVCMMGALPGRQGRVIAYEQGPEWVTGLGFAEVLEAP